MVKDMDMGGMYIQMEIVMKECGIKENILVSEHTILQMEKPIKDNLSVITNMENF